MARQYDHTKAHLVELQNEPIFSSLSAALLCQMARNVDGSADVRKAFRRQDACHMPSDDLKGQYL